MITASQEYGILDIPPFESLPCAVPGQPDTESSQTGEVDAWLSFVEDAADIVTEQLPPVVEIVGGIVATKSKLLIGSGAKSFKTWFTIDMAISVAHGVPILGRQTTRQRVLYVNLELKAETFKRRLQNIAKAKGIGIDRECFFHLPLRGKVGGMGVCKIVNCIIRTAQHFKVGLVIIDPLYKLNVEGEENSSRDQTVLLNQLDRITAEADAALVLNDHFSKGNQSEKDPLDAIRGSSAKGGDVDAAMILRQHNVEGCFRVDIIHRELPPVAPFVIGWNFPLMELRSDLDPEDMKKAKKGKRRQYSVEKLLAQIKDRTKDNPISISAWAAAAGIVRQTLDGYLPELRKKGLIATTGEGNSARQYITVKGLKSLEEKP